MDALKKEAVIDPSTFSGKIGMDNIRHGWRMFHLAELLRILKMDDAGVSSPAEPFTKTFHVHHMLPKVCS